MNEQSLKATDRKEFQHILNTIKMFRDCGYLKSATECVADFFYNNHEQILEQVLHGNFNIISNMMDAGPTKKSETLNAYITTFMPTYFSKNGNKIKTNKRKPKDIEYYQCALINFDTFKILYKHAKDIAIEDIYNLRSEIVATQKESSWTAILSKYLKWPSTDAPLSLKKLLSDGWLTSGMLSYYGYHVGNMGVELSQRRCSLDSILSEEINHDYFNSDYISQWSEPNTIERIIKLAKTIAALCRNAKRSSFDYSNAIIDWESDLSYLKAKYYTPLFPQNSEWPNT